MAAAASPAEQPTARATTAFIKTLAESPGLTGVPSNYILPTGLRHEPVADHHEAVPVIDFSLLASGADEERSRTVRELGRACRAWGFFAVVNHGVPESLIDAMIAACRDFFELKEEEKREFEGKHVLDPIRCGTSFNTATETTFCWRDFLKVIVHPEFHSPTKPLGFSKIAMEYSKTTRTVARELIKGVSESLGLEPNHIEKAMNLESGLQILIANLYPPCPQPDLAMGLVPHSDHGLLTLLVQNGVGGLQVQHDGKWVNVEAPPYAFLVNTGDHAEILSNGKYKSVLHRAVVNERVTRISIAMANGPSLDTVVTPLPELHGKDCVPPAYSGMKYREYVEGQQSNRLDAKSRLNHVRVSGDS